LPASLLVLFGLCRCCCRCDALNSECFVGILFPSGGLLLLLLLLLLTRLPACSLQPTTAAAASGCCKLYQLAAAAEVANVGFR